MLVVLRVVLEGFGTVVITMTPDQADDGFYIGGSLVGSLIPIATATASECGILPGAMP